MRNFQDDFSKRNQYYNNAIGQVATSFFIKSKVTGTLTQIYSAPAGVRLTSKVLDAK